MTDKKPRWAIEVVQIEPEDVPSRWRRFWGDIGNPYAWSATLYCEGEVWTKDWASGYTRDEAVARANAHIAKFEARERMKVDSREVLYVEGS